MTHEEVQTNADALRQSFLVTQLFGVVGTMVCFLCLNYTLKQDCRSANRTLLPAII